MNTKVLDRFCTVALLEGISCVLLFCITMPLKYTLGWEKLSYWTGMAHGVLFLLYGVMLIIAWRTYKWSVGKAGILFLASLVPFATFWAERKLRRDPAEQSTLFA